MQQLHKMLQRQPDDPFLLYGMALEHKKVNDLPAALDWLRKVVEKDPNYCYAYYQRGQVHEMAGDTAAAVKSYREGIEAAARSGDAHARSELEAALSMVE